MKKKIKTWLIILLGGVTEESRESDMNSAYVGAYVALTTIKEYADSLNGTPADEWCKLMYKQISRQLDSVTHGIDEKRPTGK